MQKLLFCLLAVSLSACGNQEKFNGDEVRYLEPQEISYLNHFEEPNYTEKEKKKILLQYAHVDPQHLVADSLLKKAILYYHYNLSFLGNKAYLSVINFSRPSNQVRLFLISMSTGAVWSLHTAHGRGSDKNNDGRADRFSNIAGSETSSLGYYLTAETYIGKHGYSLRLDGLSLTNSKVRERAIVIHGANYVYDKDARPGRSWGCPAVSPANSEKLINYMKGGSLIFAGLE